MLNKQNNVYKLCINETDYLVKFFENKESKDKLEIVVQNKEMSFKGLKEFRLFINFLTDICEELQEIVE